MNDLQHIERRAHGTFDFPFAYYYVTPMHPRYEMVYHRHSEYEIIRILSGAFSLTLDGEQHAAEAGDVYFISSEMLHGGVPSDCAYECLVFDMNAILEGNQICRKEMLSIINHEKRIQKHFAPSDYKIQEIVGLLMCGMKESSQGYQFAVMGALYSFLGTVILNRNYEHAHTAHASRRLSKLKSTLSLIRNRYHEDLTLDELALAAGMNKKYFCRFFKEMTQRSPIDYLNYYRIECACVQLASTDRNISDIALNCGFNDISYFIKVFRKYKGITPSRYWKLSAG